MHADKREEPTVITFWELTGIILLTAALLVLFFPKQRIEKAIREEKSNYDLTLIYLRSIAESYPENPDNWLRLIDAQLRMGETKEAQQVLMKLSQTPGMDKIYLDLLSFRLILTQYEKSKDPATKKRLRPVLQKRLESFVASSDPSLWYTAFHEAQRLHFPNIALQALEKRLTHTVLIDPEEVKKGFFLALSLHKESDAVKLLTQALAKNPDSSIYRLLRDHYLATENYAAAGETALTYYRQVQQPRYLLEGVQYLFNTHRDKAAIATLKKYENRYLDNDTVSEKIIQLWLANNRLQEAHAFTLRLMQHKKVVQ